MDNNKSSEYTSFGILFLPLAITIFIYLIQLLWSRRKLYLCSWKLPGNFAFPIIGHAHKFMFCTRVGILKFIVDEFVTSPSISTLWIGPILYFRISQPEYIEKVAMNKTLEKDLVYQLFEDVVGQGLFTAPVKIWKPHRRTIVPCLNINILNSYVETFAECSNRFVRLLKELHGKQDVDWKCLTTRYTFEAFSKTGLGVDIDVISAEESDEDLGNSSKWAYDIGTTKLKSLQYYIEPIWTYSSLKKEFDKHKDIINKIILSCVKYKLQNCKQQDAPVMKGKQVNFLDLILYKSNFTEEEKLNEIRTMVTAAVDTTGVAICNILLMLSLYPEVQEEVFEEVVNVVGYERDIENSDLPSLKYTEMVIKECLRLLPVVLFFSRIVHEELDLGDIVLPGGSNVAVIIYLVHRNPTHWKDPSTFDPYRFSPEEVAKRHPCAYIPFSYGPRNCIGWQYAMINLKTIISTIVRQMKVSTAYASLEEVQISWGFIMSVANGYKLSFQPRENIHSR